MRTRRRPPPCSRPQARCAFRSTSCAQGAGHVADRCVGAGGVAEAAAVCAPCSLAWWPSASWSPHLLRAPRRLGHPGLERLARRPLSVHLARVSEIPCSASSVQTWMPGLLAPLPAQGNVVFQGSNPGCEEPDTDRYQFLKFNFLLRMQLRLG